MLILSDLSIDTEVPTGMNALIRYLMISSKSGKGNQILKYTLACLFQRIEHEFILKHNPTGEKDGKDLAPQQHTIQYNQKPPQPIKTRV